MNVAKPDAKSQMREVRGKMKNFVFLGEHSRFFVTVHRSGQNNPTTLTGFQTLSGLTLLYVSLKPGRSYKKSGMLPFLASSFLLLVYPIYIYTTNEVYVFLIDDILLSPARGLFYILKQIHNAAEEEFLNEDNISAELSELYMMLETGKITEEEFTGREETLLNRLEQIEEYKKKHFGTAEESDESEDEEMVINTESRESKKSKGKSRKK